MKKKRTFPNAMIIVFTIMIIAAVLTWIIPAGKYEVIQETGMLDPLSYHTVEQSPVGLWDFFQSVYGGMSSSAAIIVFTFMVGGLFNVIIESRSLDGFISFLIRKLGDRQDVILPVLFIIMSLLGASGVMANPVVAVIPIGLILAERLKLDRITALGVMYLAAYSGYATSPICALTVQIAQKIADIPVLSGFGFRCFMYVLFLVPTLLYLMLYVKKIRKDPSSSVTADEPIESTGDAEDVPFNVPAALALLGLVAALGIYTYGSLNLGWSLQEMATVMLIAAMFAAAVTGMGAEGFVQAFLNGARKMTFSALLVGLAGGISTVLSAGNILHTIIHSLGIMINALPHILAAPVMFLFNLLFNFLVTSGSGQAKVVMPIMAPLADVVNITRQTAVIAFQLGDGLSNVIFPTSGTLMACLAIAGVNFKKWAKWMMPLFILWVILGLAVVALCTLLAIA